jgi:peptidoglycan/LPS O-acetylase OafA/YrhL
VLTSHSNHHLPSWVGNLSLGNVGVLAFFALSGLVIAEACDRFYPDAPQRFLLNRLLRIYPVYWLCCALALCVYIALGHPDLRFDARSLLANLSIVYTPGETFIWLSLVWALGIELRFYFLAALLCTALMLFPRRRRLVFIAFAAGAIALYALTVALDYSRLASFRHAPYFIFGAAVYYAIAYKSRWALLAAASSFPLAIHSYAVYNASTTALVASCAVFVLALGLMIAGSCTQPRCEADASTRCWEI